MKKLFALIFLLLLFKAGFAQVTTDSLTKAKYVREQKEISDTFSNYFGQNYFYIYSQPEKRFILSIDSLERPFTAKVNEFHSKLDSQFLALEKAEIKYYFDRLILEYPGNYESFTGKAVVLTSQTQERLNRNLPDLNKPSALSNPEFIKYVQVYMDGLISKELLNPVYKEKDNRRLEAAWELTDSLFSHSYCNNYWKAAYLDKHIENFGVKNIEKFYSAFLTTCSDTSLTNPIRFKYQDAVKERSDHIIKTYKSVDGFELDVHLFLPKASFKRKRPTIVNFHGGSWSEGKPDWSFYSCREYAKKGWVACAVEYRISQRHGTLPFSAVKDAKSAIRWLRQNAAAYNIDENRIVATGNSSGGHLVLASALADNSNEESDNQKVSAIPNLLIVQAGVFDLMDRNTAWIRKELEIEDMVKEISPIHLVKKNCPPILIIHGTEDRNCPYSSAQGFVDKMNQTGNFNIQFIPLVGAEHFFWYNPTYASKITESTESFLKRYGY